ncbi:uncharacterized protein TA12825 [Theileria annulata]|uniref:C3H1-type domain-containing protein n=1 Tax=Theileria annulata TaxID=5874 RepID=Q4UE77_THEAN|nr:uncharacterized protein TA12825 [Theileria annulata]CAI74612.1 hypothetical protein, conserved [Theileria annulata]|eukprot:XP_952344.1 hypothetical protein, conserved [Theileria annulata]
MDFSTLLYEAIDTQNNHFKNPEDDQKNDKEDPLITLALDVLKRDSEKVALLRLKGFERVDIERSSGKHSVVCRHWLKGMCMKGEFCDFLHQLVYSRMPPCKSVEKNSFCTDRLKGCCIFKHTGDDESTDFLGSKENKNDLDHSDDLSYKNDLEKFTHAFNSALLFAFPRIV